jgi:ABC-type multidrug transport system ATPase subunit
VNAGECLGIGGANGAGKTTILRLIATLKPPTAGTGTVLGARLGSGEVYRVRPLIGLAGHTPALYPELTLAENLRFICRMAGRPERLAKETLAEVGLAKAAGRRAAHCSHGMQRRADLARLLMIPPQLLLLDEAHAGLDAGAKAIVAELVMRAVGQGGSAVMVSHDPTTLAGLANRVLPLTSGMLGEPL